MAVYPLSFDLGFLEITGYGLMVMAGFLMAHWVARKELHRRGLNEDYASDMLFAAVIGGMVGAKLWYVALTQDPGTLLSRGGFVWYGGLVGGSLGVYLTVRRKGVPTALTSELVAPALAVGHALGRVGCFLVQDDYGLPTSLPWGMRFPEGFPPSTAQNLSLLGAEIPAGVGPSEVLAVHPTQLYEVAALMVTFWILWRLRTHAHRAGWLFSIYLVLTGIERFFVEFIRAKDDRLLGPFTLAQLLSFGLITIGLVMMNRLSVRTDIVAQEQQAPPLQR